MTDVETVPTDRNATFVTRPVRWAADAEITVTDDDGRELFGRLGNISAEGFMAECEQKVRVGSFVDVTLPGRGRVRAEVRWAVGWRFGARIVESLPGA